MLIKRGNVEIINILKEDGLASIAIDEDGIRLNAKKIIIESLEEVKTKDSAVKTEK